MSTLFDETEADAEVINNLINQIRRLTPMPLFQLTDGRVIRTESYEEVTQDELKELRDTLQTDAARIDSFITPVADPTPPEVEAPVAPEQPALPAVETPVEPPAVAEAAPAEPAQPAIQLQ